METVYVIECRYKDGSVGNGRWFPVYTSNLHTGKTVEDCFAYFRTLTENQRGERQEYRLVCK